MDERTEDPMAEMLPRVRTYLANRDWRDVPVMAGRNFRVEPLARGEYNLNYLLIDPPVRLVFRVNLGSQIEREEQILYEYRTLELLRESGATPAPYFVDDRGHVEISGRAVEGEIPSGPNVVYFGDREVGAGPRACPRRKNSGLQFIGIRGKTRGQPRGVAPTIPRMARVCALSK